MYVVTTAGHVDHGKSTLVTALTGQQPDRLEEERRRGLSIRLGYCWTSWPGTGEVAFVDVPGHERFLTTALSGFGPVPVAVLVVAADDPWMPQAAEHLAALDALEVRHGALVVTRSDLADPAPALDYARRQLEQTSLAGAPAVAVSGHTGEGLADLRRALSDVLKGVPAPDPSAPVRLWTDRRFHVRGAGTVVTGTLPAGTIAVGDRLDSGAGEVRVRGLESLGQSRSAVAGTARVALDLVGAVPAEGHAVLTTPGGFAWAGLLDVQLRAPAGARERERLPERLVLHVGAAALSVHVRPLGSRHARLTLPTPLPLQIGDRGVLRDPGSRALWGVRVVDCDPPPLARRGSARARAEALEQSRATVADQVRSRGLVRRDLLALIGARPSALDEGTVEAGGWLLSPGRAREARGRLSALVADTDDEGLAVESAARALALPRALVPALVTDPAGVERGRIRRDQDELPAALQHALAQLRDELDGSPFAAPDAARLRELGLDASAVTRLHRRGALLHVGGSVVLLPGAPDLAVQRLAELPQPFTTSEARRTLDTSRRVVLPLLAHLDRTGRTVRLADDRRRLRG